MDRRSHGVVVTDEQDDLFAFGDDLGPVQTRLAREGQAKPNLPDEDF